MAGTYGFGFGEWAGRFYPKGLAPRERLGHYATVFSAVEMNGTYHAVPKPSDVERWRDLTPETFSITAKAPRFLSDAVARLDSADQTAIDTLAQGLLRFVDVMRPLGARLGPIVLQLSPQAKYVPGSNLLGALFARVLRDSAPARQFAVEFRHPSWLESDEPATQLRDHGVAWVWNDMASGPDAMSQAPMPRAIDHPACQKITADSFAYVRLSGSHAGKQAHYTEAVDRRDELRRWAELVKRFLQGRPDGTAYVMISDHYAGAGPDTARELQALLA